MSLTKWYARLCAVDGVSLSVGVGQIMGLLGPNGAGKTTVLRLLTGFSAPDAGSVRICGFNLVDDRTRAQRLIGYLPEQSPLYASLTVAEQLRFVARARGYRRTEIAGVVNAAIDRFGLGNDARRLVSHLSKGMRQRVGLAQALLHDPQVLILDEPTSGLDPGETQRYRSTILQFAQDKAVLVSTHVLAEAESMCTAVTILRDGKVVAAGRTADVVARFAGGSQYRVRVTGTVPAAACNALSRIGTFRIVEQAFDGTVVEIDTGTSGGEVLHEWAVRFGLRLNSLERIARSLESAFAAIERDSAGGDDARART
ncbi:MAG: ABC transporter ATP-binding protein [Spirochaetaceae bacterium]|nr:MAG: ABC transporter ATP-binding protein [Spirochaetaceae bacterium]